MLVLPGNLSIDGDCGKLQAFLSAEKTRVLFVCFLNRKCACLYRNFALGDKTPYDGQLKKCEVFPLQADFEKQSSFDLRTW